LARPDLITGSIIIQRLADLLLCQPGIFVDDPKHGIELLAHSKRLETPAQLALRNAVRKPHEEANAVRQFGRRKP
jgi:hypothetical protein